MTDSTTKDMEQLAARLTQRIAERRFGKQAGFRGRTKMWGDLSPENLG